VRISLCEGVSDSKDGSHQQHNAFLYSLLSMQAHNDMIMIHNVPQCEERDGHEGHDIVRVLRETRSPIGQPMHE
jgi:hypothetical protein